MIDTLVIVVYDRWDNVEKWLSILEKTGKPRNVVVIHNTNISQTLTDIMPEYTLINRPNIGFDVGAFQDVCKDRLPGFPEDWKQLLWCTDDTFPMQEDFLDYFALEPGQGVKAMEISPYAREHVRTTGFSITREAAKKLIWPADPITTKQHCYLLEHRWHRHTLLDQVRRMGLTVTMAAPRETSPMFDTGYHRRQPRELELANKWGFNVKPLPGTQPKITIICPIYKSFPVLLSCLHAQTFGNWKLLLIHDGPSDDGLVQMHVNLLNDDRIEYIEYPKRVNNWGHAIRADYLQQVKSEFVLITNPDNYYAPVFLEYMLKPFSDKTAVASYCSEMVHSYQFWATQKCRLERGHVDCGGVLLRTKEAQAVGWHSVDHSADWFFFEAIIQRYGAARFKPVKGTLFVHN